MVPRDHDPDLDDSEIGDEHPPPARGGNSKIYPPPQANGSHKIVWVWACGITSLFCATIGAVVLLAWSEQSATNRAVADELKTLAVAVGKLEATVAASEGEP